MTATTAVIDASVVVRGLLQGETAARRTAAIAHGKARAAAPDLIYAEIVNALVQYVRAGKLTIEEARARFEYVIELPIEVTPCGELADEALGLAVGRGVSGYDAMYLALAEATDAVLVTADRRLAAAATRAELLD